MAQQRLLPALRQVLGLESKGISLGLPVQMSNRVSTYGTPNSSANWDMETVVTDGYERVVWLFKAVEVISGNASRLPFQITDAEENSVETHPLLRVMNKRANPLEMGRGFRKRLSAQVLLSKKGAFVEVSKSRGGQINRLDLLPPDRVRIVPDPGGDYVDYFEFTRYDGQVRNLPPERIRWIREPHPLDPFSGVTPVEAAGMSVELDHLARAYNVSFINKDGRPGGILGVDADGLDDTEMERITRVIKPGPHHAGEITAIGTGPGGIEYIDTSARPRDMAYETTSEKAKLEILAAFGVPLSMAGDASNRTFDNAEQEEFNFWHDPMLPHLDLIASAFDEDVDPDLDCGYDTSTVEALELPARRRREEARKEWNDGLRSAKEYRAIADLDEIDNAHTRALWISPAKAPVPGAPGDEVELGLAEAGGEGDPGMAGGGLDGPAGEGPAGEAAALVQQALAEGAVVDDGLAAAADVVDAGPAAALVDQARTEGTGDADDLLEGEAAALVDAARYERKALAQSPVHSFDPGDDESRRVELAVVTALDAMLARQAGVIAARIESPKVRRGTRYWTPDGDTDTRAGDASIDMERVVDASRWAAETQETLRPIVSPAAQQSAESLLTKMVETGALVAAAVAAAQVAGRAVDAAQVPAEVIARAAAKAGVAPAMLALTIAQQAMEDWLNERIVDLDLLMMEQQPSLPVLVAAVGQEWSDHARAFAESLAVTVAQTTVGGARDAAAEAVEPDPADVGLDGDARVDRYWVTRNDERVRATHDEARGQLRPVGEMFDVGGYDLRYPSDPLAPPSQARWCRCWLRYEWPDGVRFRLRTAD